MRTASNYFNVGDLILYGKWKNKKGLVVRLFTDDRGVPMVEIEPVPKGRKKNKTFSLFKIWHAPDEKEEKTAMAASTLRVAARYLASERPKEFFEVWAESIEKKMKGLDLKDPEDRVSFRIRVEDGFKNARADVLKDICKNLGVTPKGPSRHDLSKTIANAYIEGKRIKVATTVAKTASERFESRYARLLLAMSMSEAKQILGFPPTYNPTPEEVTKAYREMAFKHHPDRGGDPSKMVEVNVAKDLLQGKGRATWTPEPAPRRQPPPQAEPDATLEGQTFEAAMADSGVPANVEWKFVSIPEWYWETSQHPGHRVWTLYGQTDQKHVFLAIKERGESAGTISTDQGRVKIMEDWQTSEIDVPISQDLLKIAPKYIKMIGTGWLDAKPKPARKFVAWPGGKPTKAIITHLPRSGGTSLKDILVGTGVLNNDDPSVAGRKSVVEVFTKYSKERLDRARKLQAEGKKKMVTNADQYDFFVRVNGKTEKLEDDTIDKMIRSFIPFAMNWEISEGQPKNLTRMRGPRSNRLKYDAGSAIRELANCLTGEPSWLHIALERAAEEWEEVPKTAFIRLAATMPLDEVAVYTGESLAEVYSRVLEAFGP